MGIMQESSALNSRGNAESSKWFLVNLELVFAGLSRLFGLFVKTTGGSKRIFGAWKNLERAWMTFVAEVSTGTTEVDGKPLKARVPKKKAAHCFHCGAVGHFARDCKKKGSQRWIEKQKRKEDVVTNELPTNEGKGDNVECEGKDEEKKWLVNDFWGHHLTGNCQVFESCTLLTRDEAAELDDMPAGCTMKGTVKLLGKRGNKVSLKEVYFKPGFKGNFVSG